MKLQLIKEWDNAGTILKPEDYSDSYLVIEDEEIAKRLIDEGIMKEYDDSADEPVEFEFQKAEDKKDKPLTEAAVASLLEGALQKYSAANRKPVNVEVGETLASKDPTGGFDSFGDFLLNVKRSKRSGLSSNTKMATYHKFTAGEMEEDLDSLGGFLVPDEYRRQLLEITHEEGQVTSRCQMVPVSGQLVRVPAIDETSRATGSRAGGVRAYGIAEGAQYTKSAATFRMIKLEPSKKGVMTYASDELEEDSAFGIGQLILRLAAKELAFVMDDGVINGNGASEALGLLNAPATVSQAKETGQAAATIVYENIQNMWSRLHAKSRANAVWFINQDTEPQLNSMALVIGTGGVPVYMPAGGLTDSPHARLMSRPVIPIEQCATLGTVGDIILADMSQYLLAVKGGVQTAVSEHLRFDYDQNVYKASVRYDGQPWWASALTPYKGSNTQSPFVTLATRS